MSMDKVAGGVRIARSTPQGSEGRMSTEIGPNGATASEAWLSAEELAGLSSRDRLIRATAALMSVDGYHHVPLSRILSVSGVVRESRK